MGKSCLFLLIFWAGTASLGTAQYSAGDLEPSNSSGNCATSPDSPLCRGTASDGQFYPVPPATSSRPGGSDGVINLNDDERTGQTGQSRRSGRDGESSDSTDGEPARPDTRKSPQEQPTPLPPEPDNDFQNFVQVDTGQRLDLFGYQFFRNAPSTFAPVDRVSVTDQYVIGPGDELLVRVWGQISLNSRLTVDRSGNIYIPRVGAVNVSGVPYGQLRERLFNAISRYFHNFEVDVSVARLRSIQIYVTGFARRPGAYTVSSLSTLINALFASGGPSARGSMRAIQLKRAGKVVTELDLYDFLLRGDTSKDVGLQPEDVIVVPAIGPLVAVLGAVNVPAIYELRDTLDVASVLAAAGGLSTVAAGTQFRVERIQERKTRVVEQIPYSDAGLKYPLKDGDIVHILPLSPRIENAVVLRGNVAVPGRYPFRPGMKIRDLIPSREFLLTPAFWQQQAAVSQEHPYSVRPSVRPTPTPAQDARIRLSAPEINWNYAVVQRINPADLSTRLISFNLSNAIEGKEPDDVPLVAGDIVTIFSQKDVAVPRDQQTRFVTVEGEIGAPGVYRLEPGDTLRTLLQRAGGITPKAYLFGTQLTRESARAEQQRQLEETTNVLSGEVQQRTASDTAGARPEDAAAIAQRSSAQQAMVERLRTTRASGRLVLEIRPESSDIAALPEIALEDADRVLIPQRVDMVHVIGAVYRQSSYVYRPGTSVRHYLRLAGSAMRTADLKRALLVRADGSVLDRRSTSGFWRGGLMDVRMLPGDTLVIPTKLATGAFQRNLRDWTQIASQLAIAGTSLAVLAGL